MINIVIGLIIAVILGVAIVYIVRAKKKGAKCIGCPAADVCCTAKKGGTSQNTICGCNSK